MKDFSDLNSGELLALGRHALELCGRRFHQLARFSDPSDEPLRRLLGRMALDAELQAALVEQQEHLLPEESRLASKAEEALGLIRGYLTSLSKPLGEGSVHRDIALFFAESLEEEASRLFRALAGQAREARLTEVFSDVADRERGNFHYLREVVLQG